MKQYNAKISLTSLLLVIAVLVKPLSLKLLSIPVVVRNASARYLRVIPYLTATLKKLREKLCCSGYCSSRVEKS